MGQLSSWQRSSVEAALSQQEEESEASGTPQSEAEKKKSRDAEAMLAQMHSFQQAAFLAAASFGGSMVALLLCSTVFAAPLRRGETRIILSRPVSRAAYLLGRYLGAMVGLAAYWLVMSAAFMLFFRSAGADVPRWLGYAPLLLFCKGVMVGSIALAMSAVVRPPFAAAIAFFGSSDWVSSRGILYWILPGDDRLNLWSQLFHGSVVAARDVLLAVAYALTVAVVAVGYALFRFQKIDVT